MLEHTKVGGNTNNFLLYRNKDGNYAVVSHTIKKTGPDSALLTPPIAKISLLDRLNP